MQITIGVDELKESCDYDSFAKIMTKREQKHAEQETVLATKINALEEIVQGLQKADLQKTEQINQLQQTVQGQAEQINQLQQANLGMSAALRKIAKATNVEVEDFLSEGNLFMRQQLHKAKEEGRKLAVRSLKDEIGKMKAKRFGRWSDSLEKDLNSTVDSVSRVEF